MYIVCLPVSLLQVFYLQDYLEHMEVPYTDDNGTQANITLNNICYSPLAPQNKNCTITSVLNYFQNSMDRLNEGDSFTGDYHDHIHYCTRYKIVQAREAYFPPPHP